LESFAHIPTEVEYASEFRYRDPIIKENDLVIAISQSGETADTLAALKLANAKGAFTYSLVNTEGSTIARISDAVSYLNAGIEIGVASTKAFTSQVTLLTMIALEIGQMKGIINKNDYKSKIENLLAVPNQVKEILKTNSYIKNIAEKMSNTTNALFLGRGINFPSALEGALKLKEISYIHAEGYPAAEMKHGPIALIDENMPVIVLANNNKAWQKLISNVQEIKSRKGKVILLKSNSQEMEAGLADYVINLPVIDDFLSPIISSIPLQLFSYHSAKIRECNVDQPRNLAKSVTVE
jgi:glucosamine--fructose-6-phosphate aminotransferase (isomerizing)